MQKKSLSILGSTGSIGRSALEIVDLHPEKFRVTALAAFKNIDLLIEQCKKYRPKIAALYDQESANSLIASGIECRLLTGPEGIIEAAIEPEADVVLSAISGAAGLKPTYAAISEGKDIALANKEVLVTAGEILIPLAQKSESRLIPVDSEHAALNQCLRGDRLESVNRLVLTASGGPFLDLAVEELDSVTVDQALDHPTWNMGPKITIDSATLMNKGLEVIEAHHLFNIPPDKINVVIHPQSLVHSLVEFVDGTFLAQLSITDMKSPIFYALTYPHRFDSRLPHLDIYSLPALHFVEPDLKRFPCLKLAYEALRMGGTSPVVLNAANEIAVQAFLDRKIQFKDIPRVIESVLPKQSSQPLEDLEMVLAIDHETREITKNEISDVFSN
jgi:1-deoxy-D-xylulose-5-phosphate reductoisomerase